MNKNIIYILGTIIAILLGVIAYMTFGHNHEHTEGDGHDHGTETHAEQDEGEHTEGTLKEVELNETQFNVANIELGTFSDKNLSDVINANGYTKLPPQNQADVTTFVGGTIRSIGVIEGQYVKKGQSLAALQSLEYNNIRLEKAKLTEQLDAATTNRNYLELEFARQKELSEENVNAKKVFQKVASDLEMEKKKIANLQNQISILEQNLQVGGSAQSPILAITAPITGYITEIGVKIGSNAEVGKPLFSIVDNSKMHVDLLVYEKDLFKLKVGQKVRFILTNQDNREIQGKIFSIGKAFENETKSVAVHADIINENQSLIPGMYVNALIDIGQNTVPTLPNEAVVKADGREFIFVLEEGGHAQKVAMSNKEDDEHDDKDGDEHAEEEGKMYHFQRVEVKTGASQLGFTQTTVLQQIEKNAKIVLRGAYYVQSHLQKSEGGGGHAH